MSVLLLSSFSSSAIASEVTETYMVGSVAEDKSESESIAEVESETESAAEIETQTESESETESIAESNDAAENQVESDAQTESGTESQTEDGTQPESESESESQIESESESESENEENKTIAGIKPLDKEVISVYYSDYMKNGQQKYIDSLLPDKISVVYEDNSSQDIEAVWLEEIPFGSKGKGDYTYKLDVSKYKFTKDFETSNIPTMTLRAELKKWRSFFDFHTGMRVSGGIYDEQQALFAHAGGLESADYGYNSTQYFSISFEGKNYTGFCGKASYIAPNAGKYYVHEIPGGTRESDIVKAILLTNPLTGPYPDNTWNTIANKKFTDKMLWSVHSALSVYWSDDEYGSDWIRVNAIQEMGNYLYNEWIPAHQDIMNSTHAYYLCASKTPHNSDNFGGQCPSGRQDVLFLSDEWTPQDGGLKLKKMSANPGITEGNSCYSLAGAEYGVYTDRGCTNQVGTLTTNANGESNTIFLQAGTYYVKEIKAPPGFMIDKNIHEKTVVAEETAVIEVYDGPANDPLGIELTKIDADGKDIPSLAGAQFTVKYYDGYYTKNNLPSKATRTWVLETKPVKLSDGNVRYICGLSDTYKVGGDDFYLENGYPTLPLGTITIEETKAPEGYVLEGGYLQVSGSSEKFTGKYVAQIKKIGDLAKLEGGNKFTVSDFESRILINKVDAETGKGLAGATLRVTDANGKKIDEWVSDGKSHEIKGLIVGQTYTLIEVNVPDGYVTAEPVKFTVKDSKEVQTVTMKDDVTKILVSKKEITGKTELPGAALKIVDTTGNIVDTWISTDKPHYIEKLIAGQTYTLIETKPADGYVTATEVKFTIKDTGEVQMVEMIDDYTKLEVVKIDAATGKYVSGATLAVYPVDESGKVLEGECFETFLTEDKPHLIEYIPIGRYVLRELSAPYDMGYVTAEDVYFKVEDIPTLQSVTMEDDITKFKISKKDITNGDELPGAHLQVTDQEGNVVDEWISTDEPHYIEKLVVGHKYTLTETIPADGYTTAADIEFIVKDTGEVQTVVMKDDITRIELYKVDEQGKNLPGAKLQLKDSNGNVVDEWVSTDKPHLVEKLIVGEKYILSEIEVPEGYHKAKDIEFVVGDTSTVQKIVMTDLIKVGKLVPFYDHTTHTPKTGDVVNLLAIFNWMIISGGTILAVILAKKNRKREDL